MSAITVRNVSKTSVSIGPGRVVRAGRSAEVESASPEIAAAITAGVLEVTFGEVTAAGIAQKSPAVDLPGLRTLAWYDAADLAQLADGALVDRFPDRSGRGMGLLQTLAAARPAKRTQDGHAVLRFDNGGGQAKFLRNVNFGAGLPGGLSPLPAPFTLAAVIRPSSAGAGFQFPIGGVNASGAARMLIAPPIPGAQATAYGLAGGSIGGRGKVVMDDAWHVVLCVFGANHFDLYIDGVLQNAAGGTATQGTQGLQDLVMGAIPANGNTFYGDWLRGGVLSRDVTPAEAELLSAQLTADLPLVTGKCAMRATNWEDTTSPNGQAVRIHLPERGSRKVAVLYQHPDSHTYQIGSDVNYFVYMLAQACVSNGWLFAASNLHGDSWGSQQGEDDVTDLLNLLVGRYPSIEHVVLVGASMGGLATLQALADGISSKVRGAYLIDPVVDLSSFYEGGTYTAKITTAFGLTAGTLAAAVAAGANSVSSSVSFPNGTVIRLGRGTANVEDVTVNGAPTGAGPFTLPITPTTKAHASGDAVSDYPAKTAGRDPLKRPAAQLAGKRTRWTASTADAIVPQAANTDAARTRFGATALEASFLAHGAGHLNVLDPGDFVAFAQRCIGA
jgi:alpha-beta hydrolase superfamily lysophospholipase